MDIREKLDIKLSQYKPVTRSHKKCVINQFLDFAGKEEDFDEYDAIKFMEHVQETKNGSSAKAYHQNLIWFYRHIVDKDISDELRPPELEDTTPPILSVDDIQAMIAVSKEMPIPVRFCVAMSTVYGLRREELMIDKEDIDLNCRTVFIRTRKKGLRRWTLIPPEIFPIVAKYKLSKEKLKMTKLNVSAMFHKVCYACDIKAEGRMGWHAVRYRLIVELTNRIPDDYTLNTFLRWSQPNQQLAMLYRYRGKADQGEIIDKVDRKVFEVHPFLQYWRVKADGNKSFERQADSL